MSRSRSPRVVAALAFIAVLTAGCSSFRAPTVKVVKAVPAATGEEALRFDVELELENPNRGPIELREYHYDVSIDGRRVYTGRRAAQATLGAGATRRAVLPAVVRFDQLPADARPATAAKWSVRGMVLYVTPDVLAEILLDTSLYRPRARYQGTGTMDLAIGSAVPGLEGLEGRGPGAGASGGRQRRGPSGPGD